MELIGDAAEIPEIMQIVRESHGKLPMAIASGGTHETVEGILKHCGIQHYFDAIVTSQDVVNSKPAPDTFLEAAKRINVAPEKCRAYEDADMGIKSIVAASRPKTSESTSCVPTAAPPAPGPAGCRPVVEV